MKNEKIAKVGDKIRIVNPVCTEGKYRYGDVFEVGYVYANGCDVITKTPEPCFVYHSEYELVDDSVIDVAKEIDWQVGQVVWDVRNGRGVVEGVNDGDDYPVHVVFELKDSCGRIVTDTYTIDGRYVKTQKARSLFFSEPVVTAELYPPKKPFTPTLKSGEKVVIDTGDRSFIATIEEEKEDEVLIDRQVSGIRYPKNCIKIYKLGEEVKL